MASGNGKLIDQLKLVCSSAEAHVSQKVNKLNELMAECENIEALNEVREELQQVLQEFQVAHEAYHGLIKTESEQEESSRYYNSVLEIVSELEQEITSWLNKPACQTSVTPINVRPRDSVSTVGSRVPSPAVQPAQRLRRTCERQHLRLGQLPFKTCTSFKSKK